MGQALRSLLVFLLLFVALPAGMGCKSGPKTYASQESIERPAKPINEEKGALEHAGDAGVAVLVVGGALVLIAVPFLIFLL